MAETAEITAARSALRAWNSAVGDAHLEAMPLVNNPVWRVVAEDGRRFVLKRLPEYAPGAGPVDAFRVLGHLQAAGVPVVVPIVTDEGAIHTAGDEHAYALFPFVRSDSGNHELGPYAEETSYAIGAAIGQLDRALAECPWQPRSYVDDPVPEALGAALPGLPPEVTGLLEPLVGHLTATVSGLPVQRTHGDCNTGNVLVHKGQVSGFIDLDHLPLGPRVRDLGYYLASRLRVHVGNRHEAERDTAAMLAVLGEYVAGYHDAYPLSERERAAVVPIMLLVEIGSASWALHGWTPDPDAYQRAATTIAWIVDHLDEVIAAAAVPSTRA
ncbi:Ser/Thr protein kinase RdoA involved in Cpx stress response, MazF antagonist [Actinopolymorpha cephalotaxi]|uniref:Ser/Thr protein kinase RdoA (MazF antagonist) n=1 Tax=Actinopolymorpha cephalotaxi TaxID=504797 RepID=A0A1I2LUQ1_9ACTN|nr:phosphotransferase [Actinopolymorpha cephalotaxi]NYH81371.1 Ser/Thr protein kinase RdoA (MazF antagonist) [Actinopolymorpha cephalotaxi]SFF80741.1 Ser/Thr protein kinase RdoA involved in Cpx stress response, MazF antagonist [Actinopolymorpha cephalotaxi]